MKLYLGRFYDVNIKKKSNWRLCIFVESRFGKLNPQTGMILPIEELDDIVNNVLNKLRDKSISEIKELKFVPQTLEMYVTRIWELIEDVLPSYVQLGKVRLYEGKQTFVEYNGIPDYKERRRQRE